ncbi:MAG: hypothetical protein WC616_01420 [Candidatus Omnitrophota bacterium]
MAKIVMDSVEYDVPKEVAALLQVVSEERDGLRELAIWMTGCGYDFTQHEYFCTKRDEYFKKEKIT